MITSLQNARVKNAIKLRDARERLRQRRIIIDGARELLRSFQAGVELIEIFVCDELCKSEDCSGLLSALAKRASHETEVVRVSRAVFAKLAYGVRAEGVVGIAKTPETRLEDLRLEGTPLVAVLEGVEKPGNMGAVLRSADAAGISAVIVADGGTDLFNPNAIRASLGTIFSVPLSSASSAETVNWLYKHNLSIYAAAVDATIEYTAVDFTRPCAIVLGSEAAGLTDRWRPGAAGSGSALPISSIKLPMLGIADSLNVSATAAVLFYEALRQRRR